MAGEKYIVATIDNPLQIAVRNILNPRGFMYLSTCCDSVNLLRQIRGYSPDIVILDTCFSTKDLKQVIETIEEDMTCAVVLLGDNRDTKVCNILDMAKSLFVCPKPISREILTYSVEMAIVSFKRISNLNKKLTEVTSNFETRKFVERAKGILMERDGISENDAYIKMRKKSMDSRLSIRSVAEAIIEAQDSF